MARIVQFIQAGSDFDGLAPNAAMTSGGLFVIPPAGGLPIGDGPVQAQMTRIAYRTRGVVSSWNWDISDLGSGQLAYDGQTGNFTVGQIVTGTTSNATAMILGDVDAGAAGTLDVATISGGPFVDGEALTDPLGGAAVVNGVLVPNQQRLDEDVTVTDYEDRFDETEGLVPNDPLGNPSPIVFITAGQNLSGRAVVEFEYVPINS